MLHVWLFPALAVLAVVVTGFYLMILRQGDRGERTEGHVLVDEPDEEPVPPSH